MKLKTLLHFLGHKFTAPKVKSRNTIPTKANSQKRAILERLIQGDVMSAKEVVRMTGSPSAIKRLQELLRMFRTYGVRYEEAYRQAGPKCRYKLVWLPADQREKARGLLGGAR